MKYFQARYVLDDSDVREGAALAVDEGTVTGVVALDDVPDGAECRDLGDVALVPGLVNAHSHAFQRLIRGRTEQLEVGHEDDDFWAWRERMYRAALLLDPEQMEAVARLAFLEMALGGITRVGEFHYVHHQPDGMPYAEPNELANRVISAAREVGIRIDLLRVGYHRAGYQTDANPRQRRFIEPDVEVFFERVEDLESRHADDSAVTVGLAPHSIRAVPREWFEIIAGDSAERVVHIHASEQRLEIEQCQAEHGCSPIQFLHDVGLLDGRTTLVHATHATPDEIGLMADAGSTVCACPTTERNLGDGFLPASALVEAGVPIALGSDSHANIDLWEEMRLVEYHERLRRESRNVLAAESGQWETAKVLWPMGTSSGARCLGADQAGFQAGAPADFATVDLSSTCLAGTRPQTLLSNLTLTVYPTVVQDVFVAGEPVIQDGTHVRQREIVRGFEHVVDALFG